MSEHIGEEFDGVISGVTSNYIFVELDNTVEGAVSVAYMYDDFYYFNEQEYAMVGEKTKKKYQLGDKVRIKVLKCDSINKAYSDLNYCIDQKYEVVCSYFWRAYVYWKAGKEQEAYNDFMTVILQGRADDDYVIQAQQNLKLLDKHSILLK